MILREARGESSPGRRSRLRRRRACALWVVRLPQPASRYPVVLGRSSKSLYLVHLRRKLILRSFLGHGLRVPGCRLPVFSPPSKGQPREVRRSPGHRARIWRDKGHRQE